MAFLLTNMENQFQELHDPSILANRSKINSISHTKMKLKRTNNNFYSPKFKKSQPIDALPIANQNNALKYTPLKNPQLSPTTNFLVKQDLLSTEGTRLDPANFLSADNLRRSRIQQESPKKGNKQSEQYYIFWKKKANEYQQMNFNLQRINSALEQQLQILRHHNQKLQRKLVKSTSPDLKSSFGDPLEKQKIEKFYNLKIEALSNKIQEQEVIIKKQDQKIRELSKQVGENYKLKNFLENIQDKVSEMNSIDDQKSIQSSRKDSVRRVIVPPSLRFASKDKDKSYKTLRKANTYRYHVPQNPAVNHVTAARVETMSSGGDDIMGPSLHKSRSDYKFPNILGRETDRKFNLF